MLLTDATSVITDRSGRSVDGTPIRSHTGLAS